MVKKREGTPRHIEIAIAHEELLKELPNAPSNFFYASHSCWACGYTKDKYKPQRAHIVASAHGGSDDDPLNYILLCDKCHQEQPDGYPFDVQLVWLKNHDSELSVILASVSKIRNYLEAAAEERGGIHLIEKWIRERWPSGALNYLDLSLFNESDIMWIKSLMQDSKMKTAGPRRSQSDANTIFALVADFIKWADNRPSST
jgi:hypothetical protein